MTNMTNDRAERSYWLTREGVILIAMTLDGDVAMHARMEIANVVAAWWQGKFVPRRDTPTLVKILDDGPGSKWETIDEPEPSAPIEIAGGAAGLQKHLVALAEKNRGLDPAALKQLFDEHQIVVAVWPSPVSPGDGFLTLKAPVEEGFAQFKRGAKKIRVTMTAIPCTNKEHAELLQQAFSADPV